MSRTGGMQHRQMEEAGYMDRIIHEIEQAAREAGQIIRSAHGMELGIENKEGPFSRRGERDGPFSSGR